MNAITINYDISNVVIAVFGLIGIIITHLFTKRRKIDELLFVARKEAYTEFMKNFGMAFGPEKINLKELDEINKIATDYERRQKVSRIFAQCRLLATPLLEEKLRHLYDLVICDLENKNPKKDEGRRERDYIGYEIEALMRYDLKAISFIELGSWRLFSLVMRRFKIKKVK